MCDIAGFLAPAGERAERAWLERMVGAVHHRGPDARGYHLGEPPDPLVYPRARTL